MMDDLVAFLRARLDEEAACAQGAGGAEWSLQEHEGDTVLIYDSHGEPVVYDEGWPTPAQAAHIVAHGPARVLAEVESKRQIIRRYEEQESAPGRDENDEGINGLIAGLYVATQVLALPYADHPDYREEWRP